MKEIGNIYLCWRKGLGHRRHVVGILKRNKTQGVRFEYLQKGIEKAQKDGFTPYTEFSDTGRVYKENVLEIFGQRIMKTERSDIGDFYDFWEIDPKYKEDKYYMLAQTQGLNPADNFEFLASYNPVTGLRFLTDLAGLSRLSLPNGTLKGGDTLTYRLERENEYDDYAVKLFKGIQHVGYIKKIHSKVFYSPIRSRFRITVKAVEENGTVKRVFVKITL